MPRLVGELFAAGTSYVVVSMYDGPHQVEHFERVFDGYDQTYYALRDRWHGPDEDFGLKLTNRAGTIDVGNQQPIDKTHLCYYPSYSMAVDWDGSVLLCVQDWNKRLRFGNLHEDSLMEAWRSTSLYKRRMQLAKTGRCQAPCSSCNADGTLHGAAHAEAWH